MEKSKQKEKNQTNGEFYARQPIEQIKTFKSKDGRFFVLQVIKTCVLPVNYVRTILENDSYGKIPKGDGSSGRA